MKTVKVILAAIAATTLFACTQATADDVDPTTVKNPKELLPTKAETDSVSYLIGVNFGYFIKANNFGEKLNMAAIRKGMNDFIKAEGDMRDSTFNSQFKVSPEMMNELFGKFIEKRNNYQAEVNRRDGEAFLEKKAAEDGVVKTESGLLYRIIEAGSELKPGEKDTVMVNYKGTLIDGTEFDKSEEGVPARLFMNRVIAGWTEGLQLIGEGGKIELYIPGDLAYGSRGAGQKIGPNAALVFECELVQVKPYVEPAPVEEKPIAKKKK